VLHEPFSAADNIDSVIHRNTPTVMLLVMMAMMMMMMMMSLTMVVVHPTATVSLRDGMSALIDLFRSAVRNRRRFVQR